MIKVLKYLKKREWLLIIISVGFIVAQVHLDLKLPDYMAEITTLVQTEGSKMSEIWAAGGWMLLCALGSMASSVIVGYFAAIVAAALSKELRERLFSKTLAFSMQEIGGFSTASLITRSTNDITQIQQTVAMGLQAIIKAPILAVWAILKITGKSWQWTAATGGAIVVLLVMILVIILFALPKFTKIQKLIDNLNRITRENLTGIRVVRAYNAEKYQEDKFDGANMELANNYLFTGRIMSIMQPGMTIIMSGLTLAIYWIGAYLINAVDVSNLALMETAMTERIGLFSDMVVFSAYAMQVIMAFMLLTMIFIILPRAQVSAGRVNEVLDTKPSIVPGKAEAPEGGAAGEVELRNVSFKYSDTEEYVLKNISFKVRKGETVAFIGSTGSGKSTLVNLIPRFYDATEGEVLVDGMNVKDYAPEALYNKLGYVPQRAVLFSGTVKSNVVYGENGKTAPTDDDVKKAVQIAQGAEFVEELEGKYDAHIAQGGTNVSGGQKQRLSIARAVCRKPEIYIFDDSFSALDYKTDRGLRGALKRETGDATNLIVAQRIGTIRDADKIIVLDEGEMAGIGTHRELLETCKTYREIAYSQLSKEELADGQK